MKKIAVFLMSLILSIVTYAQVPDSVFVAVNMDNDPGAYVNVDVLKNDTVVYTVDFSGTYSNGIYSGYVNIPSDVWSGGGEYKLDIEGTEIVVASVPYAATSQYLSETKIINNNGNQVVKILANGKYLYVDAYDNYHNTNIYTFEYDITLCNNKTITIDGETLTGTLPTISELKAIFNQSQYFETDGYNGLHLVSYYWTSVEIKISALTKEYLTPYNINTDTENARVRCVYKP